MALFLKILFLKILFEILMVKEKKKPTLRNNLLLTDEVLQL